MDDDQVVDQESRYERQARAQGWRPQDQFKGDPEDWVDARTFVQRGEEIRRYTKKEVDRLNAELARRDAELKEVRGTIDEVRRYHADMEERAIQAAIDRIKKDKRSALAEGNVSLAADLDEQIEELQNAPRLAPKPAEKKEEKKDEVPKLSPEDQARSDRWHQENTWFNDRDNYEDEIDFAMGVITGLANRSDLTLAQKFDKLDERIAKRFPHLVNDPEARVEEKPATRQRSSVTAGGGEGGGSRGRQTSKSGVSALPADARAAGERFVKQGLYKSIEDYATEYWAQPGAKA